MCTPPREWHITGGAVVRAGSRVQSTLTGEAGTVDHVASVGLVSVRWDRGGQAFARTDELIPAST